MNKNYGSTKKEIAEKEEEEGEKGKGSPNPELDQLKEPKLSLNES